MPTFMVHFSPPRWPPRETFFISVLLNMRHKIYAAFRRDVQVGRTETSQSEIRESSQTIFRTTFPMSHVHATTHTCWRGQPHRIQYETHRWARRCQIKKQNENSLRLPINNKCFQQLQENKGLPQKLNNTQMWAEVGTMKTQ